MELRFRVGIDRHGAIGGSSIPMSSLDDFDCCGVRLPSPEFPEAILRLRECPEEGGGRISG
jgi:hypothetical protein